ncbi:MAG: hypothetical protein DRN12_04560 [Thermoplasmata archaeon]|nr:MAG: hypothetical protein DRN12_04560 [Thermoplasmata archaeon]
MSAKEKFRRSLRISSPLYLMVRSQYVAHITALVNASITPIILPTISRRVTLWLSRGMERITTMRG